MPINQTNGSKKIISGMIHNNAVMYHTYYGVIFGNKIVNDELVYYNISKDTLGGVIFANNKYRCHYGISSNAVPTKKNMSNM